MLISSFSAMARPSRLSIATLQSLVDRLHVVAREILELFRREIFLDVHLVFRGRMTSVTPARFAASTFSLIPPTGSTLPLSVISPVIASQRT
jgi:hypothetical protein